MLVMLSGPAHAEVYRSVNEQGEVVFSDTKTPGSERVRLPALPTYTPPPIPDSRPASGPKTESDSYTAFSFLKPKNDEIVRNNLGIIQVQLQLSPALDYKNKHRIQYYMDGKRHGQLVDKTAIVLSNIDRGSHTLSAVVYDEDGQELISTRTITVNVERRSLLQGQDAIENFDPPKLDDDGKPIPPPKPEDVNPNLLSDNPNLRTRNPNLRTPNPNERSKNPNIITPPPTPPPAP